MQNDTRKRLRREILHELESRIPAGSGDRAQSQFRRRFYFFRSRGLPFELSVLVAAARVRKHEPNFVPKVLNLTGSTAAPQSSVEDDSPNGLDVTRLIE
jgi:hypothetical protein